jgi:hypothetical protein
LFKQPGPLLIDRNGVTHWNFGSWSSPVAQIHEIGAPLLPLKMLNATFSRALLLFSSDKSSVGQFPTVNKSKWQILWAKSGPFLGQIWAKMQNANSRLAFANGESPVFIGCARRI